MKLFFLIFAILLSAQSAYAKTCLVLSGGGALGIAHVGVLKVLEEYHVPIDCIAGTSMGAIVGGLYASGYSVAELENLVSTSEWATLFSEPNNREDFTFQQKRNDLNFLMNYRIGINKNGKASIPKGAILGNHLDLAFLAFTMRSNNIHNFDQLPIPFRAVATDVETGNPVILSKGSLAKAMRASMSVPGVFLPVEIDGKFLVDGGAANNLPIDVAKTMGADRVIAVHIPTNLKKYNDLNSALAVAGQMISILIKQNEDRQIETLTRRDIYLRPDINGYSSSDFAKAKAIIKPGILAAQKEKQKLSTIAVSAEEYKTIREKQYRPKPANPTIDFVELHNNSAINNDIIKNKLSVKAGEKLSIEQLQKDLSKLYGTGNFEKISFDITQNHPDKAGVIVSINDTEKLPENPTGVSITADAKQWSEDNVRFGLNLEDNFDGDATYNMSFRLSRTMLNDLGGEAYIDGQLGENNLLQGEIYQPLSVNNGLFVNAKGGYDGRNIPISEKKQKLAEYRLTRYTSQFDVGSTLFDNDADIRVGIERGFGYANLKTGTISSSIDNDFDIGSAIIAFNYDTLDEVNFPKHGIYSISTFRKSDSTFGASDDFTQAEQRLSIVNTFGKNTIILSNSTSLSLEDDTPVQGNFLSGGFLTFSGYQTDQIFSPNIISNSIKGYRQIYGDGESLFEVPIYAGTSIEIGDYQQKRQDLMDNPIFSGSMFLGADTFFGPVYLGYGQAEGGAKSLYMFLGRTF